MFWNGGSLTLRRREYERVRGDLQRTGTESAHRTIDQLGDRETRWVKDYLHRISKAIVHEAIAHDCDTITYEELTDIRERLPGAKPFHAWAFRRLYDYTAYKADAEGVEVTQIDPAHTGQRCSKCGLTLREHRRSQARFWCRKCGYEAHADYNAAKTSGSHYSARGRRLRVEGRHVTSP